MGVLTERWKREALLEEGGEAVSAEGLRGGSSGDPRSPRCEEASPSPCRPRRGGEGFQQSAAQTRPDSIPVSHLLHMVGGISVTVNGCDLTMASQALGDPLPNTPTSPVTAPRRFFVFQPRAGLLAVPPKRQATVPRELCAGAMLCLARSWLTEVLTATSPCPLPLPYLCPHGFCHRVYWTACSLSVVCLSSLESQPSEGRDLGVVGLCFEGAPTQSPWKVLGDDAAHVRKQMTRLPQPQGNEGFGSSLRASLGGSGRER